jgi:hypothetical protein
MKTAHKFLLALALVALGTAGGWLVQGWRKDAEIADLKRNQADSKAGQYKAALDDLTTASKRINEAAAGARVDLSAVTGQLTTIRKEFKDAKPLPDNCKPDAVRVRQLAATADAVDQAIAGSIPGRPVPPEWPAASR